MLGTRHLAVARAFTDAGVDRLVLMNAGPDPDGLLDVRRTRLASPLRSGRRRPARPGLDAPG
ncbi:hypothetical protein FAIPA1_10477 [Frankia sp. AiPs1]